MAMKNNLDKPLPIPPRQQDRSFHLTTTLSVDARDHAQRFVLHALEEESLALARDDWESEKQSWARSFLDAMDALSENMAIGGWLTGVRRSRKVGILRKGGDKAVKVESSVSEVDAGVQDGSSWTSPEPPGEGSRPNSSSQRALDQLHHLLSKPAVPTPKPSPKHMLLTTSAFGTTNAIPNEDMGFDLIPSSLGCMFTPNFFLLPRSGGDSRNQDVNAGVVIYGLDEWDVDTKDSEDNSTRIIGGNFSFKGVTSASQHASLCKILRLSIYVHLSLILEQHLLSDSHVKLDLPKQRPPRALPPVITSNDRRRTSSDSGRNARASVLPSGVWSFLSRKTGGFLNRATGFRSEAPSRSSLDIPKESSSNQDARRSGEYTHHRTRTFSFLHDSIPWATRIRKEVDDFATGPPFRAAVRRIEKSQSLLSTTAGLTIPLPSLLASLAEQEDKDPSRRLTGAERSGLNSILGWEGRDARGKGMAGIYGFVRQQEVCVLYSEHVLTRSRPVSVATTSDTVLTSSTISSATTTTDSPNFTPTQCGGRARWMCFQYYSRRKGADKTLGEALVRMCSVAEDPCGNAPCQSKRRDHELRFIHGGVKIMVNVEPLEVIIDDDYIEMWESCQKCGERTTKSRMSDGTFLLSFGKYIELLVYSPNLHALHPLLCEHTKILPQPEHSSSATSSSRFNIVRHFSYRTHQVTFSLSFIEDIFDVHVPKVQLRKAGGDKSMDTVTATSPSTSNQSISDLDDPKRILRKEILRWWQDLSEYMDRLEEIFVQQDDLKALLKSLPRLPSSDDAFDDCDDFDVEATPKAMVSGLPSLSPPQQDGFFELTPASHLSATSLPLPLEQQQSPSIEITNASVTLPSSPTSALPPTPQNIDNLQLLSSLRHDFQREEQGLFAQLSKTPVACLNNVRRAFLTAAQGAVKRLSAWETKHVPKGASIVTSLSAKTPTWWGNDHHAVPGSNVIVREGDWGSIIAFTLSSQDYLRELAALSSGKTSAQAAPPPAPSRPSMFAKPSYRLFSSSRPAPDPDDARVVWQEQEVFSAIVSRKEHPRDPSAILSLRDVLRKAPPDGTNPLSPSRFVTPVRSSIPPSAWAKPAVEINTQSVVGEVEIPERDGFAGKILYETDAVCDNSSTRAVASGSTTYAPSSSSAFESHIRRGKSSSIISSSEQSDVIVNAADNGGQQDSDFPSLYPSSKAGPDPSDLEKHPKPDPVSFMNSSLTDSITQIMRSVLNAGEQQPTSPPPKSHHGLLSADSPAIDERPHIKYDWTIGKRLKFSCTVYYAKQFDVLRRRCNIENVFLKSLEKSDNWTAEGGKSRSNFWKTSDDRFIIKTLVNAWNVADLQVLIELGPSYFRYVDSTAGKPTVLAKLLGFYTVEIRNLENGTTQAKADLLVMENLFHDKNISRTFDLKGIQGRKVKVKASSSESKTLFDGEWIEGQQRSLTLLSPHSKLVLQEAIKNDSDYLSKSNIMDYSLLLGIDVEHKQIACGLVDTIGSYTFAKTLEYKAKQNLKSGKEVTVIPPNEYQERFVSAMDDYFLACPGS